MENDRWRVPDGGWLTGNDRCVMTESDKKDILVYSRWEYIRAPALMGILSVAPAKGREGFSALIVGEARSWKTEKPPSHAIPGHLASRISLTINFYRLTHLFSLMLNRHGKCASSPAEPSPIRSEVWMFLGSIDGASSIQILFP